MAIIVARLLCLIFIIWNLGISEPAGWGIVHAAENRLPSGAPCVSKMNASDYKYPLPRSPFLGVLEAPQIYHRDIVDIPPMGPAGLEHACRQNQRIGEWAYFERLFGRCIYAYMNDDVSVLMRFGMHISRNVGVAVPYVHQVDAAKRQLSVSEYPIEVEMDLERLKLWRVGGDVVIAQQISCRGCFIERAPNEEHTDYGHQQRESGDQDGRERPGRHFVLSFQVLFGLITAGYGVYGILQTTKTLRGVDRRVRAQARFYETICFAAIVFGGLLAFLSLMTVVSGDLAVNPRWNQCHADQQRCRGEKNVKLPSGFGDVQPNVISTCSRLSCSATSIESHLMTSSDVFL